LEACKNGNIEIINLMIEKGAANWNWGLSGACKGDNIEIVNLMIEKEQIIGMRDYTEHVKEVI